MRREGAALLAGLLLLAAGERPGEADDKDERPAIRCAGKARTTIVSNRLVRVYERKGAYYGCARRTGRRTRLGPPAQPEVDLFFLNRFRLRGTRVAFALGRLERRDRDVEAPFSEKIVVRELGRRGAAVRYEAQDRRGPYDEAVSRPGVSDLIVDRQGRVAWIVRNAYANPTRIEVYREDDQGRTLLDSGDAIGRASLELRDGGFAWTNNGATRTADFR